ncbi:hypothetical protein O181_091662 [Austropuccinia psidii MF-1]|uniref:Uncharacterized protein n=1 Tax=Austropuccinia psidii MF-1 TaxID=1389203 RepID=A0A9Q3P8V2_9BASI|nr:hypothetical protein [Austropuccinia psidii MF-1]
MSPVHLRNLGIPRNQPEDREGLSRTRRPGGGHLGRSGGWKDIEGNHTHSSIHFPIQQKPQTRGLERFNLASHWAELEASFLKICPRERPFKELRKITKGWNPTRKFRLLKEREIRIRENQATIQAIEEQLNQKGATLIPSGSQGVDQTSSPVASHHSGTNRSVAKSHHYSQSQVVSRRRQGYKGKTKTSFKQRQRESDPMIQKMLDFVKEIHKSQK